MAGEALICAYALNGDIENLNWTRINGWQDASGPLWVHLDRHQAETRDWLSERSGIDPVIVEALLAEETRPRCEAFGDGLLVILRGVNLNPGADPLDMISIRIWIERDRLISTRSQKLMAVQDARESIERHAGPRTTGELLVRLADGLISRIGDYIDRLESECDDLEENENSEGFAVNKNRLLELRRNALLVKRYFAPQREAIGRLISVRNEWLDDSIHMELREIMDRTLRHLEALEAVRERSALAQERLTNLLAEKTGRTMYVLTVIAAIMLPLGFIVGLLGANVGGIPGAQSDNAFWYLCAILALAVAAQVVLFRKLKWI
jgi:zinc transporter